MTPPSMCVAARYLRCFAVCLGVSQRRHPRAFQAACDYLVSCAADCPCKVDLGHPGVVSPAVVKGTNACSASPQWDQTREKRPQATTPVPMVW